MLSLMVLDKIELVIWKAIIPTIADSSIINISIFVMCDIIVLVKNTISERTNLLIAFIVAIIPLAGRVHVGAAEPSETIVNTTVITIRATNTMLLIIIVLANFSSVSLSPIILSSNIIPRVRINI